MRDRTHTYPILRRTFEDQKDLAKTINRSVSYINNCMNGRSEFTNQEWSLIKAELRRRGVTDVA